MREILFRGKRKDNGEWVYGYYLQIGDVGKLHYILTGKLAIRNGVVGFEQYEVIPESVSEFTGLTDKNGKRIFEGDIVEYKDEYGKIVYHHNEAMFVIEFDTWCTDFDHITGNEIEVVSNIQDNPELLKGGAE